MIRKLIRALAKKLGVSSWYVITMSCPSQYGLVTLTDTYQVFPWLHEDTYPEVIELAKKSMGTDGEINVVTIHRLGI